MTLNAKVTVVKSNATIQSLSVNESDTVNELKIAF